MRQTVLALFLAAAASAATIKVGPAEEFQTPCQAFYAAAAGDTIEIAPGTYKGTDAPCFIMRPMIVRPSGPGRVVMNARDSQNVAWNVYSRGIWAVELQTNELTVDITGVDFVGAAISEGDGRNSAGIRLTKGNLKVTDCGFYYNQNGILSGSGSGKVEVYESVAAFNGTGQGYEHNYYIQGTEFIHHHSTSRNSYTGQAIKCRAPKCTVEYSLIGERASAANGNTNVEIDIPQGGISIIRGNLILQSTATANSHVISIGAEGTGVDGRMHSSTIEQNTVVGYRDASIFYRHVSTSSGSNPNYPGPVVLSRNVTAGKGTTFEGKLPTSDVDNFRSEAISSIFVNDGAGDYHLVSTVPETAKAAGAYPAVPLELSPPALLPTPYAAPGTASGFSKSPMPPPAPAPPQPVPGPSTGGVLVGLLALPPGTTGAVIQNKDGSYSVVLTKPEAGGFRAVRQWLFGWLVK